MQVQKRIIYGTLFLASILLYLSFMSISLDDFDSFAFAQGINHWDKALLQVHPPGFPVYIFFGKILQVIVQDTGLALRLVSAICGAIGVCLVAWIGESLQEPKAGILAALLLIFMPGYWINSELALSDIPGMTFTLLATGFLIRSWNTDKHRDFIIGCFCAGLSLGVRPHNAIPIALAGIFALYQHRKEYKIIALAFIGGAIGLALWLIPVYSTFNGFEDYLNRINQHGEHIQSSDSLFRQAITLESLQLRIENFTQGWNQLLAGKDDQAFLAILILLLLGISRAPLRKKYGIFLLIWLIADGSKIFFFASLERPRLFLPALIPLMLLVALGYMNWRGRLKFLRFGVILLIGLFLWQSIPLIAILNQVAASPEQAAYYVLEYYPLDDEGALVVSQGSFEAAQYHLGIYPQLYTPYFDAETWSENIAYNQPKHLIVLDGDDIAPEIFDALTVELNYVTIDDRVFERSARVFPQHSTVRLQVFVQEKDLQAKQLRLPEDGRIWTGDANFSRFFGSGWYRTEDIANTSARWGTDIAIIRVALIPKDTQLSFIAAPYSTGQSVEIIVNEQSLGTVSLDTVWGESNITIPAETIQGHEITTIELHHALAEYPENHNRKLSAAYSLFKFE